MTESEGKKTKKRLTREERIAARKVPLETFVTVSVRYGEDEDEEVRVLDDQKIYMVNSIFHYRDAMIRFLSKTLLKVAATQPKVAKELLPGAAHMVKRTRKNDPQPED